MADTSGKTGAPARTIRRDATRAKALGAVLDRIAATSLDKGAALACCRRRRLFQI